MNKEIPFSDQDILSGAIIDIDDVPLLTVEKVYRTGEKTFEAIATNKRDKRYTVDIVTEEKLPEDITVGDILHCAWEDVDITEDGVA